VNKIFKNKKRSYERKTRNKTFLVFVIAPLFAFSLWALVSSVNNFNKTSIYRKAETQTDLNSFADSFSNWCKTYLATHFDKSATKIPFIKKLLLVILTAPRYFQIILLNLNNVKLLLMQEL